MQVEITELTRRGAAVMRRSHRVESDQIRFGRGTDNEVPLPDIRVGLAAAVLYRRPPSPARSEIARGPRKGLFIEQLGDTPLRVNGGNTRGAAVGPGDVILIGPYQIALSTPPEGVDAAFSVELAQPIGDAFQRLVRQSRIGLEQTHLSKRRISWALFLLLIALALVAPILAYDGGTPAVSPITVPPGGVAGAFRVSWNPGELSNQHRYFAQACGTCHRQMFRTVADGACLTCHGGVGNHIAAAAGNLGLAAMRARLARQRCADCHVEHRGRDSLVIREAALCVDCHRSLAATAPGADLRDVRGFPEGHPQFRATIVANPVGPRFAKVSLGGAPRPADHPGLRFSHAAHLMPQGFPALGYKPLVCADCHTPEPGGQGFLPITYKGQCRRCHRLTFDVALPWRQVPHGDDKGVTAALEGFYAAFVVARGVPQTEESPDARHIPGAAAPAPPPRDAREWVAQKTGEALAIVFDPKRGCFECHLPAAGEGPFRVAPVVLRTRFLPAARFDHRKHGAVPCADCHAARQSQSSADVLIPGIATCTTCHGGESAAFKAASTCTTCHPFHRPALGPMRRNMNFTMRQ